MMVEIISVTAIFFRVFFCFCCSLNAGRGSHYQITQHRAYAVLVGFFYMLISHFDLGQPKYVYSGSGIRS